MTARPMISLADGSFREATDAEIAADQARGNETRAPIIPQQVPMWAAQAALKQAGKYDAINRFIVGDASADPPISSLESTNPPVFFAWTMGNYASRQSAFISTLGSRFDLKDPDIDAVFVAADKIAQVAG